MNILAINWTEALGVVAFGFLMVFIILVSLVLVISILGKILAPKVRVLKAPKSDKATTTDVHEDEYEENHLSAEYGAAIAMAIHLYFAEVHDEESQIITIKNVERRYSPWSSKIYGLNNLVR